MAFVASDLVLIDDAIRAHIKGTRIVSLTFSDRVERRSDTPLSELRSLRDQIIKEIESAQTDITKRRPGVFLMRHLKGL